ncbi:MAG TPA: ribosomal-protein-alanine N-acetyltransferase [Chloroflexi bacterium]|nr:ribosomal-protein-alanine N-acetyltransferase [Chloroflexota bacterium]
MNLSTHQVNLITTVRPMRVDDLPQVQAIDEISFSNPWPKNAYRFELLENLNGYCWVAEADGHIVGVIVCWLILDEMHIATIAVHPDHRGQGIGKKMVSTALVALIYHGALLATLEVRAGNIVAQNLYRYFGFEQVGLRKRYYKDTGEDALLMTVEPLGSDYLAWLNSGAANPWGSASHP